MDLFTLSVGFNVLFLVVIVVLIILLLKNKKKLLNLQNQLNFLKTDIVRYEEKLKDFNELKEENKNLNFQKTELLADIVELEKENATLKTKLNETQKAFEEKIELLKQSEESLKETFNNLANEVLNKTQERANRNIEMILNPLNEEIKEFKSKIENLSKEEYSNINVLKNELKELKNLSSKLSDEANNLTKALKGDKKLQGIWGEVILEKVLELSGLRKGIEFDREVSLKNQDRTFRPDVIVHLPDNRDIIIDSKVSLNAYANYIQTQDERYLKEHVNNLRKHIDTLSSKDYEHLEGVNTLDFVFMFVGLENALSDALNYDKSLYEYAFNKRVILVSPTTLLVSLRAVEAIWRYERQAQNIKEVAKSAEVLYDKVRIFIEEFEKVGKNLQNAAKTYESAKNRLSNGIISQINSLKEKAGIKPKKDIKEIV